MTQWAHYQLSRFACVTETINLSLKQMCDCGCGQGTEQTIFPFGWQSLWLWINPDPILFLIPPLQRRRLSWGSDQGYLLIRLFAPAAHSWGAFASELPVNWGLCEWKRWGRWGEPTGCLTFFSPGSVRLFQHHSAPAGAVGCLHLSIRKRCVAGAWISLVFRVHGGHRHACLLSCRVQVHPDGQMNSGAQMNWSGITKWRRWVQIWTECWFCPDTVTDLW